MRRILTSLVITILLLLPSALFAEGQGEAPIEEIDKITGVFDIILTEENGLARWCEEFKNITGVTLEATKPQHNVYRDVLGVTFTTDALPDICEIQTCDYLAYAASGKLVPLDDYIAASQECKTVPPQFFEAYRVRDGHIYAVPLNRGGGCVLYVRKDWLDKLGLGIPKTWDQFYNVMRAFTFNDPDGNGKNDTSGYTLPFAVPAFEFDYYQRFFMQSAQFGFFQKGGRWVDGFTEPEMVDALARFQKCYAEGIIDTKFFSNKTSTARAKVYEGQAGMMEYWSGNWAQRFDENVKNACGPAAEVISIPPIKGVRYLNRVGICFGITVAAKNPAAVFDKFYNTMLDKGSGQMLFTYGIEGLHWQKKGNTYKMLPEPMNPDRSFDKAYVHPELTCNDWQLPVALDPRIAKSREIHVQYSDQLYLPQGGDNYLTYVTDIMAVKQEVFSKIVSGEYTIEQGIQVYKEKTAALNLAAVLAELNQ